jgi:mRNA interferase RelE/StbE
MANYKIVFRESIAKDLRAIPNKDVTRILRRIDELAQEPRPPGSEKLTGEEKYRIRQGNYRILYTIEDEIVTVTIVKVGHRRNVYRQN